MPIYLHCPECKSRNPIKAKKCKGCGYQFPHQGKKYRVELKHKGKRITRLVDSLVVARETEAALKADMLRGELNIQNKKIPTLNEVWEKYVPFAQEKKKSWKTDFYYYRAHIQPRLGNKRLDQISPFDLEKLRIELQKSVNNRGKPFRPATIKHVLVVIRRLFNLAIAWGLYDGPNPVKKITLPNLDNEIVRYLSPEEQARLMAVLDRWPCRTSACFVKFAMLTGLRRGELFRLKWEDIDFPNRLITLRSPKGGKTTTIPVSQEALQALSELPVTSEYVFPGKGGKMRTDFKGPWLRIKKAANLPEDFRFHDLRHHFASTLVSSGVPIEVVSKLLTHKDLKTTQRYAHLSPDALRQAAEKAATLIKASDKDSKVIPLHGDS